MAEIEIKRTNFFDGQFLKQGEFLDLDSYHLHMRRRWGFVLFDQSGVIQAAASDLTVVPVAGQKSLRVLKGMAIGKRPELAEAKEIVLREDTPLIDLTVVSSSVPVPLGDGDTGIVTVHYAEEPVNQPPSEGDVPGDTRIKEHARVTVHSNNLFPGPDAANGEPFVILGHVTFTTMGISTAQRKTAHLQGGLIAQAPLITLSPNTAPATGNVAMTVNASGGLDLSGANAANVTISPNAGISNIAVSNQLPTSMTLSFTLTGAAAGARTVTITTNATASVTFTVQAGLSVTGFAGVNQPAGDTLFKINGSGFEGATLVEFRRTGGGFTSPPISLTAANVAPTQIRVPLADIPADAAVGPVRVQSALQTVTSSMDATPPAVITDVACLTLAGEETGNVGSIGNLVRISGQRFLNDVTDIGIANALRSGGGGLPAFPGAGGETRSATELRVRVVPDAQGQVGTVKVMNAGGTVQSSESVSITG